MTTTPTYRLTDWYDVLRNSGPAYFAVPDPAHPDQMTYWSRAGADFYDPWPPNARYGPGYPPVPDHDETDDQRATRFDAWIKTTDAWYRAVWNAIDADPLTAAARFAALKVRCAQCGGILTDDLSKTYGIGPDCRADYPDEALTILAELVSHAHATIAAQADDEDESAGEDEPGPCGLTNAQHMATWKTWRDDCFGRDGCRFTLVDIDQCLKGHPDDGITMCGVCGFPGKGIHDPSPDAADHAADLAAALGNLSHAADLAADRASTSSRAGYREDANG